MRTLMDSVLARYGADALVETPGGQQRVKVFFRSVNSDAWQNTERMFSSLGEIPRGRYICLLPALVDVRPEATLTIRNKQYLLRRIEPVAAFADVTCQWCLCVEKGGMDHGTTVDRTDY